MEKEFRTVTYGTKVGDGKMRLRLDSDHGLLQQNNVEVKAKVNLENGEVTFFIDDEDLAKLRSQNQ